MNRERRPFMDFLDYLRFVSALVFVLALIGGLGWAVRHFKLAERFASFSPSARRLKVIESLPLDPRRRLLIIRRDETEHLIVMGPSGETVVETHITPPAENTFVPTAIEAMRDNLENNNATITPRLQGDAA